MKWTVKINENFSTNQEYFICNGSVFQVEVWANDDGTYHGLAQEICLDLVS